jgi:nitroreductase
MWVRVGYHGDDSAKTEKGKRERMDVDHTRARAILEVIRERRSIGAVRPDRPPRELIEQVLEAGRWAPNHHLTEPWRFFVLSGGAREALGDAMAVAMSNQAAAGGEHAAEAHARARDKERKKPLRAPVLIVVAVEPVDSPEVVPMEEVLAGGAAAQNMLLAAHALGLAARWRTGPAAYAREVKEFLGLSLQAHIIGFLYVGYPLGPATTVHRAPLDRHARWMGWED